MATSTQSSDSHETPYPVVPLPSSPRRRPVRKSERSGYIPYPTPRNGIYEDWRTAYEAPLFDIYRITRGVIEESGLGPIDWNDPEVFKSLSKLIYQSSSQYISPYI